VANRALVAEIRGALASAADPEDAPAMQAYMKSAMPYRGVKTPHREFFIRKAIGWALRQYAWTNPDEVRSYLRRNAGRLSPLSFREAAKHLGYD
jgi:3-methyladenine DNA glycosylase AlkD